MQHEITLHLTDTTYPLVHITYTEARVRLDYGFNYADGCVKPMMTEDIAFTDYPELRGLRNGEAWNLTELFCLFDWDGHYLTLKQRKGATEQHQNRPIRPIEDATTQRVFDFIVDHFEQFRWAPTIAEIAEGVHIAQGHVNKHLISLQAWGYIDRDPGKCRAICLLYNPRQSRESNSGGGTTP